MPAASSYPIASPGIGDTVLGVNALGQVKRFGVSSIAGAPAPAPAPAPSSWVQAGDFSGNTFGSVGTGAL